MIGELVNYIEIEKAFYINLDDRVDRRRHVEELMKSSDIDLERFSAVKLTQAPEELGFAMRKSVLGHKGIASIWCSHMGVLERILSSHEENSDGAFLVLEDDVQINKEKYRKKKLIFDIAIPMDLEIALISPRFRWRDRSKAPDSQKESYFAEPPKAMDWLSLPELYNDFIITGAHYVVFRNLKVVRSVLSKMRSTPIYDVDNFYASEFCSYALVDDSVGAGGFGSDHNSN